MYGSFLARSRPFTSEQLFHRNGGPVLGVGRCHETGGRFRRGGRVSDAYPNTRQAQHLYVVLGIPWDRQVGQRATKHGGLSPSWQVFLRLNVLLLGGGGGRDSMSKRVIVSMAVESVRWWHRGASYLPVRLDCVLRDRIRFVCCMKVGWPRDGIPWDGT